MRRKPYRMLPDLLLLGALALIGLLIVLLARGGWGGSASSGQTGALALAPATAMASTQPVSVTLTIPADATPTQDYAPPTQDPAAPTYDDPALFKPTPSGLVGMPTPRPSDPMHRSICAERERGIPQLLDYNPVVIIGTIQEVLPARWNTPDGTRPANPFERDSDNSLKYGIGTPMRVIVNQVIKGQTTDPVVHVVIGSGIVGQDSIDRCGDADLEAFQTGEKVLLFLAGKGRVPIDREAWGFYERYSITPQGQAINTFQSLSLSDLIRQIQTAPPLPTADSIATAAVPVTASTAK